MVRKRAKGGEFVEHENRNHFRFFFFRGWKKKWCSRGWNLFSFSCWPFQIIQAEMDVSITENIGVFFFVMKLFLRFFFLWIASRFVEMIQFYFQFNVFKKFTKIWKNVWIKVDELRYFSWIFQIFKTIFNDYFVIYSGFNVIKLRKMF